MNRNSIATFNIPGTHSQIQIEVCSIFEQDGPKVVHGYHTFDTDPELVRESSVVGQFVAMCHSKQFDLDAEIDKWIMIHENKSHVLESLPCRKHIFDYGEILPIKLDGQLFLLTAFENLSMFLETGAMDLDSYISFLDNLWEYLVRAGIDKTIINIPAFGNKIVNISSNSFTVDQKIALIVQSYLKAIRTHKLFDVLHICIHESDADKIDMDKWETVLLPYLSQFCLLPLGLKSLNAKQKGLYAGIKKPLKPRTFSKDDEQDKSRQIFISHSKEDIQEADEIYEYLESKGYKCWMDTHDITPGIPYAREIMSGFNNSNAVVVVISKNTLHSVGVLNEIDNVYKRNKIIIPFIIEDLVMSDEMSFYLSRTQWILAYPRYDEHFDTLNKAIEKLLM